MTAVAYGGCLLLAGWMASRAIRVAEAGWLRARAGIPERSARPRWELRSPRTLLETIAAASVGWLILGPVGLAVGLAAPPLIRRWAAERQRARLTDASEHQLAEAVAAISSGARAGLSPRLAVEEAARDAEPPLSSTLREVVRALELGEPLDDALARLAPGVADVDLLVGILRIHRRTGGDLPSLLDRVAGVVGERTADRRHLRAMTAQATMSGAVLAALPVAFIALLSGVGGGGLGTFYRSPLGAFLLLAGLALDALGFLWMRRIVAGVEEAA